MKVSPNLYRGIRRYCNKLMKQKDNEALWMTVKMSNTTNSIYIKAYTQVGNRIYRRSFRVSDHYKNMRGKVVTNSTTRAYIYRNIDKIVKEVKQERIKYLLKK